MKHLMFVLIALVGVIAVADETDRAPHFVNVKVASANYTLTTTDDEILASGTTTLTLPAAASNAGKVYILRKTDASNVITITRSGSDTIDGASESSNTIVTLNSQNDSVELVSDGTSKWSLVFDNRAVAAQYEINSSTSTASVTGSNHTTPLDYNLKISDTHNAVTTGTGWKFTAPISGRYRIKASVYLPVRAWSAGSNLELLWRVNGTTNGALAQVYTGAMTNALFASGSETLQLAAGDFIQVNGFQNVTGSIGISTSDPTSNVVSIERISN